MDWQHPVCEAFIAGAVGLGIPRNPDYNGARQEGVGYFQRAIWRGWRHSAARAFLEPARRSGRVAIRTEARAAAVLLEEKRATGVRYVHDRHRSVERIVRARREVVVSSGTVNTAKLLQISGIGPAALLGEIGVPVRHGLRGVGENFRDHYGVRLVGKARNVRTINELATGIGLAGQVGRWAIGRPSILAVSPSIVHWFWKSDENLDGANLQGVFTPASYKDGYIGRLDDFPGMTAGVWPHRPESSGYVRARSADPFEDPLIQPNYLQDPMDRRVLVGGIRLGAGCWARRNSRPISMASTCPDPTRSATTNCWTSRVATARPHTTWSAPRGWGPPPTRPPSWTTSFACTGWMGSGSWTPRSCRTSFQRIPTLPP